MLLNPKLAGGGADSAPPPSWFFLNNFSNSRVSKASLQICEKNLILHILTKFYDDDVIHKKTKTMAISSTSTSGIFTVFYRNL